MTSCNKVNPDLYLNLAGGVFAMNRARAYAGVITWLHHSNYYGFEILRAQRRDTGRPAALYGFIVADTILVVSENLNGIRQEAKKYADPNEVV